MRVIEGIEGLLALAGQEIGTSDWLTVEQSRIQAFADATGDHQWIHVDEERARRESPLGGPVAHGYLTLSLLPMLNRQVFDVQNVSARINYGLNRVRFPTPVPSGARVRSRVKLMDVERTAENRYRVRFETTIETDATERPACIVEHLTLYLV